MPITSIVSINQLITWFEDFQENHYFLKDFGFGEPYDIGTSRQMDFPYMWVTMNEDSSIQTASNVKSAIPDISFSVMFMDKINNQPNYLDQNGFQSDNSQEILSDTLQCLQDLITMIQQNWGQYGVLISQDVSFYPAVDETQDKATGVVARIVLRTRQVNCVIPESPNTIVVQPNQPTYATLLTCESLDTCSTFQTYAYTGGTFISGTSQINLTSINGHVISITGFTASTSGSSGSSGQNGSSGTSGANGTSGSSGVSGSAGVSGSNGSSGSSGVSGANGTSGSSGQSGTSGANGTSGSSGNSGTSGSSGANGANGTSGSSGDSGTSGSSGNSGTSGTSGQDGLSNSFFNYQAKTNSQSGDPGNGHILWNNVTQSASTSINVSELEQGNINVDLFLSNLAIGSVFTIQDQSSHLNYQTWTITSKTDNSTYWTYGVTLNIATHSFSNNDQILFIVVTTPSGTSGSSGSSGQNGTSGSSGDSGTSGSSGVSGANGTSGSSGVSGANGTSGSSGISGTAGSSGSSGVAGATGTSGSSGVSGTAGTSGTSPATYGSDFNSSNADYTLDASLYDRAIWVASFSATRTLNVINMVEGQTVNVFVKNLSASARTIQFRQGGITFPITTTGGVLEVNQQSLVANQGCCTITYRYMAGNILGSIS